MKDILIASVDGLSGFPDAINSIFPDTEVQLCIIHQIRNSMKYVASKNQKAFMADLKPVYRAVSKEAAEIALDELEERWGKQYPIVIKSWRNKWHNLSVYFKYPEPIRKVIYTTNAVEAVHRQFRKLTKTKGAFPNDPKGSAEQQKQSVKAVVCRYPEYDKKMDHANPELEFDFVATGYIF